MPTPNLHRSRTILAAGGISLLATLGLSAPPANAAPSRTAVATMSATSPTTPPAPAAPAAPGAPAAPVAPAAPAAPAVGQRRAAAGQATLEGIKTRSAAEIARRQGALSAQLILVTGKSPSLSDADRSALTTLIKNDQAGLQALGSKIAADTDLATAKADHQKIYTEYRVYALVIPQIRLVRANDALINVALPRLTDARSRLQSALTKAGKTDEASATMADLQTQIDLIRANSSGLSAQLLALTPAQWNADRSVLSGPRTTLQSSHAALEKARADIVAVRAMLKA